MRVENADADRVIVQAGGGGDKLTAIGDVAGLTLEGDEGADDLTGAMAAETLRGGPGNDRARGNGGADRIELGEGDDVATFRLADGPDTITGDGGVDRLAVQGTAAGELVEIRATRVGAANVSGVETVEPAPGSGTDTVDVGDLTGSAIKTVAVDLGGLDSRLDTVSIAGTAGPDKVKVAASGAGHAVTGLAATVTVDTTDPGQKIVVHEGAGDDEVNASEITKDKTQPFLLGGPGKDVLIGSPGQDVIAGGTGVDVAFLGGGLDTYTWIAGDGNDIVEGGAGTDFLRIDGAGAAESYSVPSSAPTSSASTRWSTSSCCSHRASRHAVRPATRPQRAGRPAGELVISQPMRSGSRRAATCRPLPGSARGASRRAPRPDRRGPGGPTR